MSIQYTNFFDGELRYIVDIENGNIHAHFDDFFDVLLGANKALQKRKTKDNYTAIENEYFNIFDLNSVLMEFEPQKATVQKKPQNYRNYISFMTGGGFQAVFWGIDIEIKLPQIIKDISELIDGIPVEVDCEAETASLLEQNEYLSAALEGAKTSLDEMNQELMKLESKQFIIEQLNELLKNEKAQLNTELESQKSKLEALEAQQTASKSDTLRGWLTNNKVMLYATILAICVFLPFTVLNLKQYIAIPTANTFQDIALYALCIFIAAAWDFSILLFAVNGKKKLAVMGSCFQFIFIASKFNFFASYVELLGWDGALFQKMIVITAIVVYSPVLIFQFAELAVTSKDSKVQN